MLAAHSNQILRVGVRLREELSFSCYEDLKAKIADKCLAVPFGLFVDCWMLMSYCNLSCVSGKDFLDQGQKVPGNRYSSSLDAWAASTFNQRYPYWLVGAQKEFWLGTLLPEFLVMDQWLKNGAYGSRHEIGRELKNAKKQLAEEIRLQFKGDMKYLASYLFDTSYDFIMLLLWHTDLETLMLGSHKFDDKQVLSLILDQMRQIHDNIYNACITTRNKMMKPEGLEVTALYL